jgi:hypothetical protein
MRHPHESGKSARWATRIAWLVGIWVASVGALALVAYVLRWVMDAVGMTTGAPR